MIERAGKRNWFLGARRKLYEELDASRHQRGRKLSMLNRILSLLIILVVTLSVIETEPMISVGRDRLFQILEDVFGTLFSIEYAARIWTAVENPRYGPGWRGRLRYVLSPAAILDLSAIIVSFGTGTGLRPYMLRIFRLARILRLAKLGRMSRAMSFLLDALWARRDEFLFSIIAAMVFLTLSATALYMVEGPAQPDKFGSIPRAMWWAVATLTTVGYGDVYPITPLGKVLAAFCAIAGIGLIAMPTGIMAAAFSDALRRHHEGEMLHDDDEHEADG